MSRIMTAPEDIRPWAQARGGNPMLMETPNGTGSLINLTLTFGQHALNGAGDEGFDSNWGQTGAWELVDWDAWFAEFDKQGLAVKVNDDIPGVLDKNFEFVSRDHNSRRTNEAAQQPPAVGATNSNDNGVGGRGDGDVDDPTYTGP